VKPRIGATLVSTADDTMVVVVRWGPYDLDLTCGGALMVDQADRAAAAPATLDAARAAGTHAGRRYHDEVHGVELLCTTAGWGDLAIGGAPLELTASSIYSIGNRRSAEPASATKALQIPGVR
jgi:hypothetical protein